MEHIGKIVAFLILAINAFFVGTLILSAYSPYLSPKANPLASSLGLAFPIFLAVNFLFLIFGHLSITATRYCQSSVFWFVFRKFGRISLSIPPPKQSLKEASNFYPTT